MALYLWYTEQYRGQYCRVQSTVQFEVTKLLECLYYCCKAVDCRGSHFMIDSMMGTVCCVSYVNIK